MLGIYFSGSGTSAFACKLFVQTIDESASCIAITDDTCVEAIVKHQDIIFAYPIYYSSLAKIVVDFIEEHSDVWNGKNIFLIATMGLFSGDGSGCGARLLSSYKANILGGLHVRMPDCICDVRVLKTSHDKNQKLINAAKCRIQTCAHQYQMGNYSQQGLSKLSCFSGWITQRLWFSHKTKVYHALPHINRNACTHCGRCVSLCPIHNLIQINTTIEHQSRCTLCYRCANYCPNQAITILGKTVYVQSKIEDYR